MLNGLKFKTAELDPLTFQAGIFFSEANTLSPMAVRPENRLQVPAPQGQFQTLTDTFEEQRKVSQVFANYALIGGLGQYTAEHYNQAGLLARLDIFFRIASDEETKHDFREFGEQVMAAGKWSELSEEEKKTQTFLEFLGEKFVYTGPPRIVKSLFTTQVFPSAAPESLAEIVKEVDILAEQCKKESAVIPEMITQQGYQLFVADKGCLKCQAFRDPKDYNLAELKDFGLVEISQGKLLFHPLGRRDLTKDFSVAMYKP